MGADFVGIDLVGGQVLLTVFLQSTLQFLYHSTHMLPKPPYSHIPPISVLCLECEVLAGIACVFNLTSFLLLFTPQITAALLAIAGFVMIFSVSERAGQVPTHPHAIIGILLMFFMLIQPINGIL